MTVPWRGPPGRAIGRLAAVIAAAGSLLASTRGALAEPADPFTHRFTSYEGYVEIAPGQDATGLNLRVAGVTTGDGRDGLVLSCGLQVLAVLDPAGAPLDLVPWGSDPRDVLVRLPAPLPDGTAFTLQIAAGGSPACFASDEGLPSCGSVDGTTWVDLAKVLPRSAAGLDFATMDLSIEVPEGRVLAGSGDATDEGEAGGRHAWRLRQEVPAYTRGYVLGTFVAGALSSANGTVRSFTRPGDPATGAAARVLVRALAEREAYAAEFGPPMQPALSLVQVDGAGAALALAGTAWLPRGAWTGEGGGTIHPDDLADLVLPHEIAHQWFPISAMPSPLDGTWLSEGLAEWMAVEAIGRERGAAEAASLLRDLGLRWRLGVPVTQDVALSAVPPVDASMDRDLRFLEAYAKPAVALRAIEAAAGPDAFREVLRGLVATLGPIGGFLDATVLRQRLEDASGKDLEAVVDAWTRGHGFPIVRLGVAMADSPPGWSVLRLSASAGASIGGGGMVAATPTLAVDVRTDQGTTRVHLVFADGEATAWVEVPGRFLDVLPDPDAAAPGTRFLSALAGDVDGSGEVDGLDLLAVAGALGATFPSKGRYRESCDADASGAVDATDLAAVVAAFGTAGPTAGP